MKSVLVTGATGFIGRHTLVPLLKRNFHVHAVYAKRAPIQHHPQVQWHEVDLHEKEKVTQLIETLHPTHLLHLAWYAKPEDYRVSQINLKWLNSSIHLLNTFIAHGGMRAVLTGTCFEYDLQFGHCREEATPCVADTLYGRAKHALYLLSDMIAKQNQLSFAWGRPFFLFGSHEYAERLIPAAISHLLNAKMFEVMCGDQIKDFMYVADVADAFVALLDSTITGPVNIASGQSISIRDIIISIGNKLKATDFISFRENPTAAKDSIITADVTRLNQEVAWLPRYSLETALDETIAWWQGVMENRNLGKAKNSRSSCSF